MNVFQHGALRVEPGKSARGILGEVRLPTGSRVEVPYVVFHGAQQGPTLVVTAASHGFEIVGIGAVIAFMRALDATALRGTVIVVPVVNPPAVAAALYVSPMDSVNMSGPLYWDAPGGGTTSHRLGALIGSVLARADFYIDLHGNLSPCVPMSMMFLEQARDAATRKAAMALGAAFGVTPVDMSAPPAHPKWLGPMDAFPVPTAMAHGIPSLMVELVDARTLADSERGCRGLFSVLRSLNMLDGSGPDDTDPARLEGRYGYWGGLESDAAGLMWVKHPVGVPFQAGTLLLEITDSCGELLQEIRSPVDGFCWAYLGTLYGHATHAIPAGAPVTFTSASARACFLSREAASSKWLASCPPARFRTAMCSKRAPNSYRSATRPMTRPRIWPGGASCLERIAR